MRAYFGPNIAEVFEEVLIDVYDDPDFIASPRGFEVKEIRDCSMEIENPMLNLYKNPVRSSKIKYIAAELLWYFSGTNNPTFIENYASMWKRLHNEDGTVNSSYGNLLFTEKNEHGFTQYQWVMESLKKDKDSRQAFMHFNKPHHQFLENKDQVCTLQALFHIRDNKLYMTLTMRSNDIIYGFMTDWAFFSILHYHVYLDLKVYYPELRMGSYTHISHSMHLYDKHYDLVGKMLGNKRWKSNFQPDALPLLSEPVIYEDGKFKDKYSEIFYPITIGEKPDFNKISSDNPLIQWCIEQLREPEQ